MANVLHIFGAKSLAMAASTTYYPPAFSGAYVLGDTKQTTEDYTASEVQNGGTISNVCIYVSANDRGTSTLRVRVNGANGNTNISITASTTGQFEDTSNTDSADDGEELCYSIAVGSGGTTFAHNTITHKFTPTSGTHTIFVSAGRADLTGTSDTYMHLTDRTSVTTEAYEQTTAGIAGTFQRLSYYIVGGNTRSDTINIRSRINGATGNMVCTFASGATGIVRDDSNTDTIAEGDEINLMFDQNGGSGSVTSRGWSRVEFAATDAFLMTSANPLGTNVSFGTTRYICPAGVMSANVTATEDEVEAKSNFDFTWSDLYMYVDANSVNGTTTVGSRINRANGNLSLSYASSTNGYQSDTSNTDSVVDDDEIDIFITCGGSSGTFRIRSMSSIGAAGSAPAPGTPHRLLMTDVGI